MRLSSALKISKVHKSLVAYNEVNDKGEIKEAGTTFFGGLVYVRKTSMQADSTGDWPQDLHITVTDEKP